MIVKIYILTISYELNYPFTISKSNDEVNFQSINNFFYKLPNVIIVFEKFSLQVLLLYKKSLLIIIYI
jgi:hypothetical protein